MGCGELWWVVASCGEFWRVVVCANQRGLLSFDSIIMIQIEMNLMTIMYASNYARTL